ncbi:MAG: GAF domain-containing sensor histidine kinase [Ktedonobacterales bacterium]
MDDQDTPQYLMGQPSRAGMTSQITPDLSTVPAATANHWLRILQHVTEGAVAHLDLEGLLHELLDRIREAMKADNTAILLLGADGTKLTLYAARGPEEEVTGKVHVPVGRGVAGTIAARREPLIIDDLSQVEVENPLLRATAHSLVGVPLLVGDRVLGVLHVDSAQPRQFTSEDSLLLQLIADHVVLAIEHAQLYTAERAARRQAESMTQQLSALQAVSDVALEHARLQDLLRALLERVQQLLEVDNVAILLPEQDGKALTLYTVHGAEEAVLGQVHVPFGEGVAGTIAATRKPLIVENLATVPVANPFLREHFRSLLGVPLLADDRLVGVIHVDSVQQRIFTDAELQLLQVVADRIAVAIDRAHEYERIQQDRVDAERRFAVLQETTERMDEFLGIASHELRTPLTTLTMNLQMLDFWLNNQRGRRQNESDAEYATRALPIVKPLVTRSSQSIKRLDRLVDDLLDASRIRDNQLELKLARTDLVTILREAIEEQRDAHANRVVQLEIEAQEPVFVEADSDRLSQVVTNFMSNAFKFSAPNRPVTLILEIESDQHNQHDQYVRISVRDEGVGIARGELDRIWERLYRVEGVRHQSGSQVGLGLGLYISRDIVERHGGRVGVESRLGKGSTFWFTIPLSSPRVKG